MNESRILIHAALALAEGLDFPQRQVVTFEPENALLRHVAAVDELEGCWPLLEGWMHSLPSPETRLDQLRANYYHMFMRPGADLFIYLHRWYPDRPTAAFLREWQDFSRRLEVVQNPEWRNGQDHLALAFEMLAHTAAKQSPYVSQFILQFFRPWFPGFVQRIGNQACNDFYRGISILAAEAQHAMEAFV